MNRLRQLLYQKVAPYYSGDSKLTPDQAIEAVKAWFNEEIVLELQAEKTALQDKERLKVGEPAWRFTRQELLYELLRKTSLVELQGEKA